MKNLEKQNIEDILALTPMQEGMLFHYLKEPGSDLYFEQLTLGLSGKVEREVFDKAWNFVIKTNEMLRTGFRWEKVANPIQVILKEHKLQPKYHDLSGMEPCEEGKHLKEIKIKDRKEKFDLQNAEVPFRVTLCKLENDKYEMIISNHHILYDGWSNGIILREFFAAYNDLSNGKEPVKPVKTKFKEFIKWNQAQVKDKQEKFWRSYLKGFDGQTELSIKRKRKRKGEDPAATENLQIRFEKDLKDNLENFVKKNKITLSSLFYSAWGLLLQKYNNSEDVIFGTTVSGRSTKVKGIEDVVGLFINTLPLRVKLQQSPVSEKIGNLLPGINRAIQTREEYESTPLVDVKKYSKLGTTGTNDELFDSILTIENYPLDARLGQGGKLSPDSYSMVEMTHYDLTVGIILFNEIEVKFTYHRELFDKETVENLARHFKRIVQSVVENPEEEVSQLEIISKPEKNRILYDFNNTAAEYPEDKTIHQLFEEQVERTPDYISVVGRVWHPRNYHPIKGHGAWGMALTYRQ